MTTTRKAVRVLLVDDDDAFRRVMSGELARRGYAEEVKTEAAGKDQRGNDGCRQCRAVPAG